jgi:Ser/Thr protein kinase RdoA (MazF antagonist)
MLHQLNKLAERAALHHRYEPDISWLNAWRMALSVPLERMKQIKLARSAMARYDVPRPRLSFISASGNLVFRVVAEGRSFALRISAPGRRTMEQVRAELAFADELSKSLGIRTPHALPGHDGDPVQMLGDQDGGARLAVLFPWMPGVALGDRPPPHRMELLGRTQARMHAFALAGVRSTMQHRPVLTMEEVLRWTDPPRPTPTILPEADRQLVERVGAHVRKLVPVLFERYPTALVHFDLQGSNLLMHGDEIGIIDLDDCLEAPIILDVATTLAYTTTKPDAEALRAAYLKGLAAADMPPEHLDAAMALIALREVGRVLDQPRITTKPWGPKVVETSVNVLRTLAARMHL